jgi:hypothetical protein
MKNTLCGSVVFWFFFALLALPAQGQTAQEQIEAATGEDWTVSDLGVTVYRSASGDSAISYNDNDWRVVYPSHDVIKCRTIDAPVSTDTLSAMVRSTLDGDLATGMNGALGSFALCVGTQRVLNQQYLNGN